jgi:ketosteroid isomerase-like protein
MFGSFRSFAGDWQDMQVRTLGPDAAVVTATFEAMAVDTSDTQTEFRGVWTAVFARSDEGWKIVACHESWTP